MQEHTYKDLRDDEVKQAVTQYLMDHPNAMDTFDGIAQWWVPRQHVRFDLAVLANVLNELTGQGILEEVRHAGEVKLYHLREKS
jgi:hypothetical protein